MESSSRCSSGSGCQSGWTLYLDHSNGGGDHQQGHQQCCSLHCKNQEQEEEDDDSMVSDASSGPLPYLLDKEEEELRHQAAREQQRRRHRRHLLGCHATGYNDPGSRGGSRSTSSHGLAEVKRSRRKRRAIVGEDNVDAAVLVVLRHPDQHDGRGRGDDLDDTASSSAVSSSSLQPRCAFSVRHLQQWSSAAAVQGRTILQAGYAMLHRN